LEGTRHFSIDALTYPANQPNNLSIRLTPQERIVLSLAADGLGDKQIGQRLGISPHTVNTHLKSVYRKLSANSRTSAIAAARKHKLL
jgi:DNA-binding CsgD family transcriptional regulator